MTAHDHEVLQYVFSLLRHTVLTTSFPLHGASLQLLGLDELADCCVSLACTPFCIPMPDDLGTGNTILAGPLHEVQN